MGNLKPCLFFLCVIVTKVSSRFEAFPLWKYWCYVLTSFPKGQGCDGGICV